MKTKIGIIALGLSIVALGFVGYSQIDIQDIKKAVGATKKTETLISEEETLSDQINKLNRKMNKLEQTLDRILTRYSYRIESIINRS